MHRFFRSAFVLAAVLMVVSLSPVPITGQTWNPPRTPDGQPDIQGFWADVDVDAYDLEYGFSPISLKILGRDRTPFKSAVVDPADGKIPYQPWAAAKAKDRREHHVLDVPKPEYIDPLARCFLAGVPRVNYEAEAQILQIPGYVVMVAETNHAYRIIPLGGRPHIGENVKLWMGDSRGRWEGNTLVVETTNLNDKTWFDIVGAFHSDTLHVVERYTIVDADRISYEVIVTDPRVFTKPWKIAYAMARNKAEGYELMEHACREGDRFEKDALSR